MSDAQVVGLVEKYDSAPLECDGLTRVLHTVLVRHHIAHTVKIGRVEWNDKHFSPHFWIELPGGKVVDYRLRMWLGPRAPHGVFDPAKAGVIYEGRMANLSVLTDFLFGVLTGTDPRIARIAAQIAAHRLSVWDFDDTLVSSSSSVTVEHGDGEITMLDSASFAYYKGTSGDKIDFKDFNNVTHPRVIKKNMDAFKQAVGDKDTRTVVLTARPKGSASAVKKFLESVGIKNAEVVALQSSDPMDKERWIEKEAKDVDEVEFTDDSSKNVAAVGTLQGKIKGKVKTNNPAHPKEEDYEGEAIGKTFESDDPTSAKVEVKEEPKQPPQKEKEEREQPSEQKEREEVRTPHTTSPWWNKQSPEFQHQYCKEHPESGYCRQMAAAIAKIASDMALVRRIAESVRRRLGASSLQCCQFTTELCKELRAAGFDAQHIYGHVFVDGNFDGEQWGEGPVSWYRNDKTVERWMDHHWVEIDEVVVDIAADQFNPLIEGRGFEPVFIGKSRRHKKQIVVRLEGTLGKPMAAGVQEVIEKITRRVRDSELARCLAEKVMRFIQTKNPADDLTPSEVAAIYRRNEYGDDFDMPGGQELDVGWTNHAEYRSDLRSVDPSRVNEAVRDFAETHPNRHQKVNLVNHNMGKAVVDMNTSVDPEQAEVVTVIASSDDVKRHLSERARTVKSEKVKKYVQSGLLKKIEQAGDAAGAWLEKLEADFGRLKPEGMMQGFTQADFDDLWFVLTGEKRKKSADQLLFPGQKDEQKDMLGSEGAKMNNLTAAKELAAVAREISASAYEQIIMQILRSIGRTDIKPSYVEAYLRLESQDGCLDSWSRDDFRRSIPEVVETIDADPVAARRLAESYGLRASTAAIQKRDITRPELVRLLGDRRFSLRKVSFRGLGYGEAYTLRVEGIPGGNVIPTAVWEANKDVYAAIKNIKENYTWMGLPIISA